MFHLESCRRIEDINREKIALKDVLNVKNTFAKDIQIEWLNTVPHVVEKVVPI
jgi:hypothetical protein